LNKSRSKKKEDVQEVMKLLETKTQKMITNQSINMIKNIKEEENRIVLKQVGCSKSSKYWSQTFEPIYLKEGRKNELIET
jgi:hypothetical protein